MKQTVLNNIERVSILTKNVSEKAFKNANLTVGQFDVLDIIGSSEEPVNAKYIVSAIYGATDLPRMLDRLVAKGYITRERSTVKRREIVIDITTKGFKALTDCRKCRKKGAASLNNLSGEQLKQLNNLLNLI